MKLAGMEHRAGTWVIRMILQMCVLLSVMGIPRSLTPPRIIYGGWTPILPGHPFYFGPVSGKNVESLHQQSDFTHAADDSYHQSPLHNTEHHFEQHVHFIAPQQQQLNQYSDQRQPQQFNQYTDHQQPQQLNQYTNQHVPQQLNQYTDQQQLQQFNQYPDQEQPQQLNQYTDQQQPQQFNQYTDQQQPQQFNQYADQQQPQQFNQYTDQRQIYPATQDARHPIEDQQVPYFGAHKEIYPQQRDKKVYIDAPVEIQQVPLVHKLNGEGYGSYLPDPAARHAQHPGHIQPIPPQNNVHLHVSPQGGYGETNIPPQGRGQPYFPGQKSGKNIFSYYPPHSIYDEPKQPKIQLKPVYFESAGTRANTPENPHQQIPYAVTAPIESQLKSLGPLLLNSLDHGIDQKSYLKITPLGHVDPGALKQLGQIALGGVEYPFKNENYPLITDSSGGAPKYPRSNSDSLLVYSNKNSPLTKVHSGNSGGPGAYEFRPNSHLPRDYKSLKLESSQKSRRPFNPIETKSYSSEKKAMKLIGKPPIHLRNQRIKYTGPKILPYGPIRPYYPRKVSPHPYRLPGSQTLVHLPLRSAPRKYLPNSLPRFVKNVKLQTIYQSPSVVTKSVGPPVLVEQERPGVHVPVPSSQTGYPRSYADNDYVYYTAATTESTQVSDAEKFNRSAIDHGRPRDTQITTFNDPTSDGSTSHDNSVDDAPYHHEYRYIFVSSDGIHKDGDVRAPSPEKQFFHAYYAPADHEAPPGYAKMTVQEFNNLFKNAEIRYVDKDPDTVGQDVSTRNQAAS